MTLKKFFRGGRNFLLAGLIFFAPETCSADVQFGDSGEEVEEVQRYLIARNFLSGEVDGIFGEETETALKNFQSANGLDADGICGAETFQLLRASREISQNILQFGDSGEKVSELQNFLIELGYLSGGADGIFGEETERALKNFQSANGLDSDGIFGEQTFSLLTDSPVPKAEKKSREETTNNLTQPDSPLRLGDQSYEVRELQDMLIGLGYLTGAADGVFGETTEQALKNFQSSVGLEESGIFDEETFELLNSPSTIAKGKIPADGGYAEVGSIIKPGMHGPGVENIQRKLIDRGFLDGEADGWCGAATVEAIRDFQYRMGLPADGIFGILTYAALENSQYATDDTEWKKSVEEFPKFRQTIYVEATAYTSAAGSHTASGTRVRRGVIAVDPQVIPLGTRVYIPGYGEAVAEDTGGAIIGNKIDIAFDTYEEAMQFGRQSLQIYIIDE